ncbi:hypothetical protein V5O48_005853 [Marasmius crinis-equi]|uniref:Uncharacterized protein n=1 Tax=Marasmius crinis-equi TaxID=585013 RepID=A0ABR3FLD1_9AGAR
MTERVDYLTNASHARQELSRQNTMQLQRHPRIPLEEVGSSAPSDPGENRRGSDNDNDDEEVKAIEEAIRTTMRPIPATLPRSQEEYVPTGWADLPPCERPTTGASDPEIDAEIDRQMGKIRKLEEQGQDATSYEDKIRAWAEKTGCGQSPATIRNKALVTARWNLLVNWLRPKFPRYSYWDLQVVERFMEIFMTFLVDTMQPRPGKDTVKARTLLNYLSLYISLVVERTWDPISHKRCGMQLLLKTDGVTRLKYQVVRLIQERKLDRISDPKLFYGREELAMLINGAFSRSHASTWIIKIGDVLRIIVGFYLCARPGSMGAAYKEYAANGNYMKIRHVRIIKVARGAWLADIDLESFKGYNQYVAKIQQWVLSPVAQSHNLLFCPGMWMVLWLFFRNAFKTKFKELVDDPSRQLELDPAMFDDPMFPKVKPGGREFMIPLEPATSHSISESVAALGSLVGLPRVGMYPVRRESSTMFMLLVSETAASQALAHRLGNVFNNVYSRGTAMYDSTSIMMSEDAEVDTLHNNKTQMQRLRSVGVAVRAIASVLHKESPALETTNAEIRSLWTEYIDCFDGLGPSDCAEEDMEEKVERFWRRASGEDIAEDQSGKGKSKASDDIELKAGKAERAQELKGILTEALAARQKEYASVATDPERAKERAKKGKAERRTTVENTADQLQKQSDIDKKWAEFSGCFTVPLKYACGTGGVNRVMGYALYPPGHPERPKGKPQHEVKFKDGSEELARSASLPLSRTLLALIQDKNNDKKRKVKQHEREKQKEITKGFKDKTRAIEGDLEDHVQAGKITKDTALHTRHLGNVISNSKRVVVGSSNTAASTSSATKEAIVDDTEIDDDDDYEPEPELLNTVQKIQNMTPRQCRVTDERQEVQADFVLGGMSMSGFAKQTTNGLIPHADEAGQVQDVDEGAEEDVLGVKLGVHVNDVRIAFMGNLIDTIREREKYRVEEGDKVLYRCPHSEGNPNGPCPTFKTLNLLEKHLDVMHNEWKQLEREMPVNVFYECPARDHVASTIHQVQNHMRTKACREHERYEELYQQHLDITAKYRSNARTREEREKPSVREQRRDDFSVNEALDNCERIVERISAPDDSDETTVRAFEIMKSCIPEWATNIRDLQDEVFDGRYTQS